MAEIPLAPLKRIIKSTGATRVSDGAVEYLAEFLEQQTELLSEHAMNMAKHTGRKTIHDSDFELAIKTLYE